MSSTYSTNLALELIGTGDQAGTWGNTTNNNLGTLIEQAISGYVVQTITDGADTVLTMTPGASATARNMFIECQGTLTAGRNLIVPSNKKLYFVYNNTTGGYSVTVKVAGQTGVTIPNGAKVSLVCNGTDIVAADNYMPLLVLGSPMSVVSGGTGVSTLSGLAYGNGTSAFTAATASQIVTAIGSTAVQNATNATSATTATTATSATSATTATNIANGAANQIPYQTAANTTAFVAAPTTANYVLSYNGSALVWAAQSGTTNNALTFNNSGSGAATGSSFNGGSALTISYNTIGAPSVAGTNATGTWPISISGNAATVTNGLTTTNYNSYAPTLTGTGATGTWNINITGSAASATSATNATNVTGTVGSSVTGTTQTTGDNSTLMATDAFVYNMALGWGQTWTNVASSRAFGTTYTNSTGKPIQVIVSGQASGAPAGDRNLSAYVNGNLIQVSSAYAGSGAGTPIPSVSFIVPNGSTYQVAAGGVVSTITCWNELR